MANVRKQVSDWKIIIECDYEEYELLSTALSLKLYHARTDRAVWEIRKYEHLLFDFRPLFDQIVREAEAATKKGN